MNKEKKNSRVILDLEKTDDVVLKMLFDGFARAEVEDGFIATFGGFNGDTVTIERVITLSSLPIPVSMLKSKKD